MASLDATVVNIAGPSIVRDLGGGLAGLQWVLSGYTLSLSAFLLLGGALGDRFGRRRIFLVGVVWFTAASIACGCAGSMLTLTLGRVLQGIGGALLTPGSLAILGASFRKTDRAAAIGAWSGFGGVTLAIGPFIGGYLIQAVSWRLIFFINVPLALVVLVLTRRCVPETRDPDAGRLDIVGAVLAAIGLGAVTAALIEAGERRRDVGELAVVAGAGVITLLGFLLVESRRRSPMLDLGLFRCRPFGAANLETLLVYAALGGALFLLPVQLQSVLGYSPLAAGAALLPTTAMLLLLSSLMGRVAERIGPRIPMTVGPLVAAVGIALLARVDSTGSYATRILPAMILLGVGVSITVAPLTATVLAAAPSRRTGLASAINNAVARTGSLLAVALLPAITGLGGGRTLDPAQFATGYPRAMWLAAAACACGGLVAWARVAAPSAPARVTAAPTCPLDAPPLR
jgi:EmrB/QacA subfamily drug resistance transporter